METMFSQGRLTSDSGATRKGNSEAESKVGMKLEFLPEGSARRDEARDHSGRGERTGAERRIG